ncbi:MAG: hypothetical protein JST16_06405 [Bdellovibrionales bacterium]|nr:hypothetical protein [Bdellovibrionales bacterium]
MKTLAWLAGGLFALSLSGVAQATAVCGKYYSQSTTRQVGFCVERSRPEIPLTKTEPVVYFMHGMGGNSTSWEFEGFSANLAKLKAENPHFPAMTFISFDTAVASYFSDVGNVAFGPFSYETWFVNEFMPLMQKQLGLCSERKCRAVAGVSMGGFGALKTAFRHPELFSVVTASSPAILEYNAHAPDSLWEAYFGRHPVGVDKGMWLLRWARVVFPNSAVCDESSPEWLVQNNKVPYFPDIYFDVGDRDDFGFQEGYASFSKILRDHKVPFESQVFPGADHYIFRTTSIHALRFLAKKLAPNG